MNIRIATKMMIIFVGVLFLFSCDHVRKDDQSKLKSGTVLGSVEKQYGVIIHGVTFSAGGYMLDFRYTVTDPEKSKPFFNKTIAPYLIDNASGAKMKVPNPAKVGPLRTAGGVTPEKGRRYFIIFANPGSFIKKGNKVTIVIGDIKIENLVVQ